MSAKAEAALSAYLAALDRVENAQSNLDYADYEEKRLRSRHVASQLRLQQSATDCYEAALAHDRALAEWRAVVAQEQAEGLARLERLDAERKADDSEDTSWWAKTKAALKGKN